MTDIAWDDEMWQELASTADAPLARFDFKTMTELAKKDLAPLLEGFGYREPPPPPVSDLVDSTLLALNAAARPGADWQHSLVRARETLLGFEKRVREQIRLAPFVKLSSTLRKLGRWACGVARDYGPLVIAAAGAGATGEALVLALGAIPGKAVEKAGELLIQFAAAVAVGLGSRIATVIAGPADPIDLHLGALALVAGDIRAAASADHDQLHDLPIHARRLGRLLREEVRTQPGGQERCGRIRRGGTSARRSRR